MAKHNIQTGSVIRYTRENGSTALDAVIRVEGNNFIIKYPTIGGTWRERAIHISQIQSYTNKL